MSITASMHVSARALALIASMFALFLSTAASASIQRPLDHLDGPKSALATSGPRLKATASAARVTSFTEGATNTLTATATVTGVDDDGGGNDNICLEAFDDFYTLVAYDCQSVAVGTTTTLTFNLSWNIPIGQVDPGIGLYLRDEELPATLGYVDPLTPAMAPVDFDGIVVVAPAAVPTLSLSGLATLVLLLGWIGWRHSRIQANGQTFSRGQQG